MGLTKSGSASTELQSRNSKLVFEISFDLKIL
jgi:hypothetical protein